MWSRRCGRSRARCCVAPCRPRAPLPAGSAARRDLGTAGAASGTASTGLCPHILAEPRLLLGAREERKWTGRGRCCRDVHLGCGTLVGDELDVIARPSAQPGWRLAAEIICHGRSCLSPTCSITQPVVPPFLGPRTRGRCCVTKRCSPRVPPECSPSIIFCEPAVLVVAQPCQGCHRRAGPVLGQKPPGVARSGREELR